MRPRTLYSFSCLQRNDGRLSSRDAQPCSRANMACTPPARRMPSPCPWSSWCTQHRPGRCIFPSSSRCIAHPRTKFAPLDKNSKLWHGRRGCSTPVGIECKILPPPAKSTQARSRRTPLRHCWNMFRFHSTCKSPKFPGHICRPGIPCNSTTPFHCIGRTGTNDIRSTPRQGHTTRKRSHSPANTGSPRNIFPRSMPSRLSLPPSPQFFPRRSPCSCFRRSR